MRGGITLQPGDRRPWSAAFQRYAEWNHREGAELFVDQTRKLATELYVQTAAIAPTEAEIAADVKKQGWKIPRRFADGRLGRGVPANWTGWSYWMGLKRKEIRKVRGRGAKAKNQAIENAYRDQKPTLEQMQAFVIAMRKTASKYLASGWLGAIMRLGGNVQASSGKVDYERGGAEVRRSPTEVEITLWNRTPGIEKMEAERGFVEKAVAVRVADMWVYISRKVTEAQRTFFRTAA